jgi:hypothetical protein
MLKLHAVQVANHSKLCALICICLTVSYIPPGVRLTSGGSASAISQGNNLEVYDSSTKQWGLVCGATAWGNRQRTQACEQLGKGPAIPFQRNIGALALQSNGSSAAPQTNPLCVSSTNKKSDCDQGVQWGAATCLTSSDLSLNCQPREMHECLCRCLSLTIFICRCL